MLRTRLSDFLLPALSDFRSSVYSYDSTFIWLSREDLRISPTAIAGRVLEARIQTVLCLPLLTSKGAVGTPDVGSRRDRAFSDHDQELLNQVAAQLAIAFDHARAYREIATLKDRLAEERVYLQDEIGRNSISRKSLEKAEP